MILLVANQIEMTRDTANQIELLTNQVQLLTSCSQIKLLTNQVTAQQNEYGTNAAGPKLLMAARDGDASRVQTLLSAPGVQFYITYTDRDGRTPLFAAASNGHAPIVEKLMAAGSNVNLAKTNDGATPILIAAQRGHAPVEGHLT